MIIYGRSGKEIIKMFVDSILFYPMLFFIGLAILFLFDI